MPGASLRPRSMVGAARTVLGSRRRRGYATWSAMPEPTPSGSTWWSGDPHWFPAGTPPRLHSTAKALLDGQQTFLSAWQAIAEAKHSVWVVSWSLAVDMEVVRGQDCATVLPAAGAQGSGYRVFDLLTAAAARGLDVRVLLWSGSRFFRPRAKAARDGLRRLKQADSRIAGVVDKHTRSRHCHHQKTIIVDGRIAFVGGLDMTNFDADRWDLSTHAVRTGLNWHDLCLRLEGAAAADVGRNFIQRWQAVTGEQVSMPDGVEVDEGPNGVPVQVLRTIPAATYPVLPQGEFGVAWAYQQAIRAAHSFIYLENQYLWAPAVADELIAALRRVDDPLFRIVLVLPAHPNIGKRDTDIHISQLREADAGRGRVQVFTLYTSGQDDRRQWIYKPIYVHAKVAVIDDQWCTLGSANLNGRGLEGDSEVNVQVLEQQFAKDLRLRLWSEHLGLPVETLATLSPQQAIDTLWRPLADQAAATVAGRRAALGARVLPYQLGEMPGDLSLGELEALLLDR